MKIENNNINILIEDGLLEHTPHNCKILDCETCAYEKITEFDILDKPNPKHNDNRVLNYMESVGLIEERPKDTKYGIEDLFEYSKIIKALDKDKEEIKKIDKLTQKLRKNIYLNHSTIIDMITLESTRYLSIKFFNLNINISIKRILS